MKFFILGLGSIGLRHAKNLLALGHEVCGYDMDIKTAVKAAEMGIDMSPNGNDADAYVICTPPSEHFDGMVEAIDMGKHIFVEKPIGLPKEISDLSLLLDGARRKNLVVMVGNNLRFHQPIKELKAYLGEGSLGKLLWANICVAQRNTKYREPVVLNWGAHEIDLALYLLGSATVASAVGADQIFDLVLSHVCGAQSTIHLDYLVAPEIRRGIIVGTDNRIEYQIRIPDEDYVDEIKEFIMRINRIKTTRGWVGATGDNGLATLKIIAEAMRAVG